MICKVIFVKYLNTQHCALFVEVEKSFTTPVCLPITKFGLGKVCKAFRKQEFVFICSFVVNNDT